MTRKMIQGKHLGKVTTVDMKTGKTEASKGSMMMLPAKAGTCEQCAYEHKAEDPHNAQSIFYQYFFYNDQGRWPDWNDAMAHCSDKMKELWKKHLTEAGVDHANGKVNP